MTKPAVEVSSPACSMHEADDAYMGYAGKDELTALLNELLEAEHAGARVTLESARAAGSGPIAELMRRIRRDEARWCAMLCRSRQSCLANHRRRRSAPSMARQWPLSILASASPSSIAARPGWCESCANYCPACASDQLHADLAEMLRSHEANIALASDVAGHAPVNDARPFESVDVAARVLSTGRDGSSDRIAHRSTAECWVEHSLFQWSATWMRPRSRPGVG